MGSGRKWERAAILLQKYDPTLAEKLSAKSEFWQRGGTWSDEAIQKAGIGLERIKREVDDRLRSKNPYKKWKNKLPASGFRSQM